MSAEALHDHFRSHGQDHVLRWWPQLSPAERNELHQQLAALDLPMLRDLYARREEVATLPAPERIAPIPVANLDPTDSETRRAGEEALRRGEVAVLIVAGGQGTRLGFDRPKGLFPIGPVSNKSLFQIHAEKVLALGSRYGKALPLLVMTSTATHDDTARFFEEHRYFGLNPDDVTFFRQGTMPALDLASGRLLMEAPHRLFLSPNGHGGTLTALAESGLLDRLLARGFRHLFYFQVDNPLVVVADLLFLGHHLRQRAEVSSKAIVKHSAQDKLGNLVLIDGRCSMIEYSDLPEEMARQTDADGRLRFRVGNPAIHIFDLEFIRRVTTGDLRIPFHVARKKVPQLDEQGNTVQPVKENALKFEMFIFDLLPRAERCAVVETDRDLEFHPLKNATGPDSAATVRQALIDQAARWLEQAGVVVPRGADGKPVCPLEISPLFALDGEELRRKVGPQTRIARPTYFG
jgi:UDP-N-acetylglucosamine/UDP-N-acetylgalactosamine diphosphorylase